MTAQVVLDLMMTTMMADDEDDEGVPIPLTHAMVENVHRKTSAEAGGDGISFEKRLQMVRRPGFVIVSKSEEQEVAQSLLSFE